MELKKELLDFLIWIDQNDYNFRVENGHLTALVADYISNGYNKTKANQMQNEKLINTIKTERTLKGTTIDIMADHCGIASIRLYDIENHLVLPSVVEALKISRYLDIPVNELFKFVKDG